MTAAPTISWTHLAISASLVLIAGTVSLALRLKLTANLALATVRTVVQLTLVGYVLAYVFALDNPWMVAGLISLMAIIAGHAASKRVDDPPFSVALISTLALTASTYLIGVIVCAVIVAAEPWYRANIVIPFAGMILGNTLTAVSLTLDRLFSEIRSQPEQIELRLSFGFTPWEALRPMVRRALHAGMTPMINAMMVAGVVSLPGMMTGQILGGADPQQAVRYQIVVMTMLMASVALSSLIAVGLAYRRCFDTQQMLQV